MSDIRWTSVSRAAGESGSASTGSASAGSSVSAQYASPAASAPADYHGYVALAGGNLVAEVDVATDAIISEITGADTAEGVSVAPNGATVYVAETGQYHVLAVNAATKAQTKIEVGAYPQDVAVSPDGKLAYARVTGGDTGPGGSDVVAAIDTATNTVTHDIRVGPAPRQVVFSPNGAFAYVTTESGIDVIGTATSSVIRVIGDRQCPQGIAVSLDGRYSPDYGGTRCGIPA
jgi:YVTN family beta-propeller protein